MSPQSCCSIAAYLHRANPEKEYHPTSSYLESARPLTIDHNFPPLRERFLLYFPQKNSVLIQKGGSSRIQIFWDPFLEFRNRGVVGVKEGQTFSEKIFPLQKFTFEYRKGWGQGSDYRVKNFELSDNDLV